MELKEKISSVFADVMQGSRIDKLKEIRKKSYDTYQNQGFPTKKQEAWKFTSLNKVINHNYQQTFSKGSVSNAQLFDVLVDKGHYRLVFTDGVFSPELSYTEGIDCKCMPIADVFCDESDFDAVEPYFSKVACKDEVFTALNTAVFTDGAYIFVSKNTVVETPIELVYIYSENAKSEVFFPRNLIVVEPNARLSVIEQHKNLSNDMVFIDSVTEISVMEGAILDYYKIENDTKKSILIDNTYTTQKGASSASLHTFSLGGDIVRNNLNFNQQGEGIESTLKGITILDASQHTDHYTLVRHAFAHNESHQDYKTILMGESSCAFNGKIWVDKIAQKTNAYQQNDTILLSEKAVVNTKPQLEIFADDVKCSHGCTVGQLDRNAVFYLQTRGIPKKEAEALLTYAFAHTVLSSIQIEALKVLVNRLISEKLER